MYTGSGIESIAAISIFRVLTKTGSTKLWRIVHRVLEKILEKAGFLRISCAKNAHFG
jgi:hypothetical protein